MRRMCTGSIAWYVAQTMFVCEDFKRGTSHNHALDYSRDVPLRDYLGLIIISIHSRGGIKSTERQMM
jgi:hypothetical protein